MMNWKIWEQSPKENRLGSVGGNDQLEENLQVTDHYLAAFF